MNDNRPDREGLLLSAMAVKDVTLLKRTLLVIDEAGSTDQVPADLDLSQCNTFVDPNGEYVKSEGMSAPRISDGTKGYPAGSLEGFTLNGKNYVAISAEPLCPQPETETGPIVALENSTDPNEKENKATFYTYIEENEYRKRVSLSGVGGLPVSGLAGLETWYEKAEGENMIVCLELTELGADYFDYNGDLIISDPRGRYIKFVSKSTLHNS